MFYIYRNFRLQKEEDFAAIEADAECVLENAADDAVREHSRCDCIGKIVCDKLSLSGKKLYRIFILEIPNPNAVTDYKKIWGLGGFREKGIFDGYYDGEGERIYFGISAAAPVHGSVAEEIELFVSEGAKADPEKIFSLFEGLRFRSGQDERALTEVCRRLAEQTAADGGIVVYNSPYLPKIYAFGKGTEKLDTADLPAADVVEYPEGDGNSEKKYINFCRTAEGK